MAMVREHVNYPHEAGYLFGCNACEFGPCQCAGTNNAECVSSDHWERGIIETFNCSDCGATELSYEDNENHGGGICG